MFKVVVIDGGSESPSGAMYAYDILADGSMP